MQPTQLGVLPDNRTPEQQEFDIKHDEIFGASVPTYLPNYQAASEYVGKFPVDNQFGTSSCVAHGKVLVTSIFNFLQGTYVGDFIQLASMFIYRNRVNYPEAGMIPSSANTQTEQQGAPIYADLPTPQTEDEANALTIDPAMTTAAKQFAAGKWVTLVDPTDIDTIAFVSNDLGLPLNILIYATEAEWSQANVDIITQGLQQSDPTAMVRHCITVLPHSAYTDEAGKKWVIVQDSADFGGIFFRSVADTFIAARVYECDYMIAMGSQPVPARPKIAALNTDLTVGSTGPDVTALQQVLQYMGYLPNVVNGQPFAPTGNYLGMTKSAVLQLQNEYAAEILTPEGLTEGTGYAGSSTRAFINKLFASA